MIKTITKEEQQLQSQIEASEGKGKAIRRATLTTPSSDGGNETRKRRVATAIKRLLMQDNMAILMAIYALVCYCMPVLLAYALFMVKYTLLKSSARMVFNGTFLQEILLSSSPTAVSLAESLPILAVYSIGIQVIIFLALIGFRHTQLYKVAWRSAFLGSVLMIGVLIIAVYRESGLVPLGIWLILNSVNHLTEYLVAAIANPDDLCHLHFLLFALPIYNGSSCVSVLEYMLEWYFWDWKSNTWVMGPLAVIGITISMTGLVMRKWAIGRLGRRFEIRLANGVKPQTKLITTGLFGMMRHPSFVGFCLFGIGLEFLLANPIMIWITAFGAWYSFRKRVKIEEKALIEFFGKEYLEYRERVPSGFPFFDWDATPIENLPVLKQLAKLCEGIH